MSAPLRAAVLPTVAGPLAVVVDPEAVGDLGPTPYGAVVASGFSPLDDIVARLEQQGRMRGVVEDADLGEVATAVAAWDAGDLDALDRVSVAQPGGPFLQRAWTALRGVHAGETDTYTGLAARAGSPTAVRAAGSACARNRVAPFVPCHRILRSDGTLGGYYYGLDVKRALLAQERATPTGSP
ncbi:MAG: methylated-DNA--[protein]-cysteine S-methyltransferase [Candidatus Nanopelagicales bacterium]